MKKILLTSLFVFGLMFSSTYAMGSSINFSGRNSFMQNQFAYKQTLRPGMVNAQVLALQKKLKEFGFYHKLLDSDYGSGTIAAVKQFQIAKGLKPDGIAGPKTFTMVLATDASSLNRKATRLPFYPKDEKVCTKEYKPVCGMVSGTFKTLKNSSPVTYSNACMAKLAHARILYKGKCQTTRPVEIKRPVVTTQNHTNVTNESVTLHGSARMNGFITTQTFFVFGQDFNRVSRVPDMYETYSEINEYHESLRKLSHGFGQEGNFGFSTGSIINDLDSGEVYYYSACVEFTNTHSDQELVCGDVKKFETLTNNNEGDKNCLVVRPNSSNSPVIAMQNNKQVAEFELTNVCKKDIVLNDVDFEMISSFGVPQINHMDIYVDGHRKDTVINVDINTSSLGTELSFTSEVDTRIDAGEDVDLWVQADILGAYVPWLGSPYQSTAFAISFNDADMTYQGSHMGWNQRPVWDNLIVVHYAQ